MITPPIDAPTTWASSTPQASRTSIASSAIRSNVYGPSGLSLRPAPRLSKAMTRKNGARAMRCRSQPCLSVPNPWMNSTAGRLTKPHVS